MARLALVLMFLTPVLAAPANAGCFLLFCWPTYHHHHVRHARHGHHARHHRRVIVVVGKVRAGARAVDKTPIGEIK